LDRPPTYTTTTIDHRRETKLQKRERTTSTVMGRILTEVAVVHPRRDLAIIEDAEDVTTSPSLPANFS
jgi:hypothetical protein